MKDRMGIAVAVIVLAFLLLAFSMDDPKYYGPGNIEHPCPTNQPTNCN